MKSKSATLEDVARHAGVSYQTVSRVLNKSANVSKATRSKVEKSNTLRDAKGPDMGTPIPFRLPTD